MLCRRPDYLMPTATWATKIISVCLDFAYEHDVVCIPTKTVCMFFDCKTIPKDIDIYLDIPLLFASKDMPSFVSYHNIFLRI